MPSLISGKIRQAMATRLEDPALGYNASIQPFASQLGVTIPPIDFSTQAQFFQAQCSPALIEDGSAFSYPLMLLYGVSSDNSKPQEKFREFAGFVTMAVEVIHSWDLETVDPAAFENTADAVEAALFQVFNSQQAGSWLPPCALYSGQMKQMRRPVESGGLGLLMQQSFTLSFQLFV